MRLPARRWWLAALLFIGSVAANLPAIRPIPHVDLARFMGTWYLVGGIPTRYERDAWNAVETYTLRRDGSIRTTLTFNHGRADGPRKHIEAPARVRPGTGNAVWDVRVFGPMKAQYVVAWLRDDYSLMVVARDALASRAWRRACPAMPSRASCPTGSAAAGRWRKPRSSSTPPAGIPTRRPMRCWR